MKSILAVFGVLILGIHAHSYEFTTGRVFLRGVVGPTVNVFRCTEPDEESPGAALMLGVEVDYVVTKPWSLIGGFRPTFSPGFIDLGLSAGAKFRWHDLGTPVIPYVSLEMTTAWLLPVSPSRTHFNWGLRPSVGFDYFLMRDIVVGGQIAINPSWLMTAPLSSFESSIDIMLSVMWSV